MNAQANYSANQYAKRYATPVVRAPRNNAMRHNMPVHNSSEPIVMLFVVLGTAAIVFGMILLVMVAT